MYELIIELGTLVVFRVARCAFRSKTVHLRVSKVIYLFYFRNKFTLSFTKRSGMSKAHEQQSKDEQERIYRCYSSRVVQVSTR
jgi:hypothetical protein